MPWPFSKASSTPLTHLSSGLFSMPTLPGIPQGSGLRCSSLTLWSTAYLPPGPLAGKNLRLFSKQVGEYDGAGHQYTLQDTNMREAGRVPGNGKFLCTRVAWHVTTSTPETDLECLAEALSNRDDSEAIKAESYASWDLTTTTSDIGPLWANEMAQSLSLPSMSTFAIQVSFSKNAPALERLHKLCILLNGTVETAY